MKKRVISAVVMLCVAGVCVFLSPVTRVLFIAAAAVLAGHEMCAALAGAQLARRVAWIGYVFILGQEARKRLSFVKRFFGFDTFYMDKDGKVTLVEGKYTVAEYSFTEFASLEDMRQYLDKQKKDDAQ